MLQLRLWPSLTHRKAEMHVHHLFVSCNFQGRFGPSQCSTRVLCNLSRFRCPTNMEASSGFWGSSVASRGGRLRVCFRDEVGIGLFLVGWGKCRASCTLVLLVVLNFAGSLFGFLWDCFISFQTLVTRTHSVSFHIDTFDILNFSITYTVSCLNCKRSIKLHRLCIPTQPDHGRQHQRNLPPRWPLVSRPKLLQPSSKNDRYICTDQSPTFFGCCTIDPCGGDNTGCPASNLRAAGMGTDGGPDGMSSNDGSYWPNVQCPSGQWWTCAKQTPSFQGCCDINPCQGAMSCPVASLHAAAFQTIPAELGAAATTMVLTTLTSALAASARSSSSSQSTITDSTIQAAAVTPSSPTTSSISTATPPALANGDPLPKPSTSSNIGAIAGGAAGGLALLIAILLAIWVCRRKRCKTSVPVHHEPHMTFASAGQNEVSNSNYEEFAPATGPDKAQIQPHNAGAYSLP